MFKNMIDDRLITEAEKLHGLTGKNIPPLRLFHHQDILQAINSAPLIESKALLNTLNYIHFTDGTVMVHASEPRYGEDFILPAHIDACPAGGNYLQPDGRFAPVASRGYHLSLDRVGRALADSAPNPRDQPPGKGIHGNTAGEGSSPGKTPHQTARDSGNHGRPYPERLSGAWGTDRLQSSGLPRTADPGHGWIIRMAEWTKQLYDLPPERTEDPLLRDLPLRSTDGKPF